jgi:TRAP transporter 4TM/12TM fusion protein
MTVTERDDSRETDERGLQKALREADPGSRYRTNLGPWIWLVAPLASALTLYQLYIALFGGFSSLIQGAYHVGGALSLIFLLYPARRVFASDWRSGYCVPIATDILLAGAAMYCCLYIVQNYDRLTTQAIIFGNTDWDNVVAIAGVLLVLEATRRCVGLPIVIVAGAAIAYALFGDHLPVFEHPGYELNDYATQTFFTASSIFGTPIQVSTSFIFLFLFFGVLLVRTNVGSFFNDLAFAATGRYTGGTAKAAVVASATQGMVSGSSVANTVASGSFTIPMMIRAGFRRPFAAATEASASTGGQMVPPIMGAAAFIMAEYTGVPYSEIILLAIVPAVLYFSGVFLGIHFEARKRGVLGVSRDKLPKWGSLARRLDLLLPLGVIIYLLFAGRSPANAALWGIVTVFVLSLLRKDTRMGPMDTLRILERGARAALPVIAACACAGIVAGTVTKTGLGGKLAGEILDLAMGHMILVLFFTMIACLILGMGLPTTANYVVTATVAAPILVNEFDVPIIVAHLFVFYFGVLADITPPVCLAAYAAAGIAGANPMRSGVIALKLATAGFVIPFVFVLEPNLLIGEGSTLQTLPVLVTALLGMTAISAGTMGYLLRPATTVERVLLIIGGGLLVYPQIVVSLLGVLLVIGVVAVQYRGRESVEAAARRAAAEESVPQQRDGEEEPPVSAAAGERAEP